MHWGSQYIVLLFGKLMCGQDEPNPALRMVTPVDKMERASSLFTFLWTLTLSIKMQKENLANIQSS